MIHSRPSFEIPLVLPGRYSVAKMPAISFAEWANEQPGCAIASELQYLEWGRL